jgi:hypothetical protein
MKMKVLQIYLSLTALCQWIFMAACGSLVAECLEPVPVRDRLLLYSLLALMFFGLGLGLYVKIFSKTAKSK